MKNEYAMHRMIDRWPFGALLVIRFWVFAFFVHCIFHIPHSTFAATPPTAPFFRLDSLFIIAATGEPRFAAARDSAEGLLRADPAATLEWLVDSASRPGRSLTPRQNHYMERLFTLIADSGRDSRARAALARAIARAATDSAQARWLYIGSRIGDTAFRATARTYLRDTSTLVRRMAVRALGAYPHAAQIDTLWDGLPNTHGLERHMRLWALGEHASLASPHDTNPVASLRRLAPLLADSNLYNRRKVRDLMLAVADSSWMTLRAHLPAQARGPLRREWWLLAHDARPGTGGEAFLKAERVKMTEEDRRFFGVP